jgi:low affinity Fe/Cu permease
MSLRSTFQGFAKKVASAIGNPITFILALALVIVWACLGPLAQFSETWQLLINTGTTIITFLVVFLIQATQNRDSKALHLKLDELIHVMSKARDKLIDAEDLTEEELDALDQEFKEMRKTGNAGQAPSEGLPATNRV